MNNTTRESVSAIIRTRIEQRLTELGISANAASVMAGLERSVLRKFLNGDVKELRDSNLRAVAAVLGVSPAWLRGETEERHPVAEEPTGAYDVPVVGVAETGAFRPHGAFAAMDLGVVENGFDPNFPDLEQFAFRVVGNHMERAGIVDGSAVVCVDPWDISVTLNDREIVVLECKTASGEASEWSVRELAALRDAYEFRIRSATATAPAIRVPLEADLRHGPCRIVGMVVTIINRRHPVRPALRIPNGPAKASPGPRKPRRTTGSGIVTEPV